MRKFNSGEQAIIKVTNEEFSHLRGRLCQILHYIPVMPGSTNTPGYAVKIPSLPAPAGSSGWITAENSLGKLPPKKQEELITTWDEVENDLGWNPTK